MSEAPGIAVVGSVNLDLVAEVDRLPAPGETVTGACLTRVPGGKGANQALAAARLGARVRLVARTGDDDTAEQALALLREDGVDLDSCGRDEAAPTGVALVIVAAGAENQVVVASGANRELGARHVSVDPHEAVLVQLEIDDEAVVEAARQARRLLCVNAAPARSVPDSVLDRADLVVVNRVEAAALESRLRGYEGVLAVTLGADGAVLSERGVEIARCRPPRVEAVDPTGAGDAFCAALVVSLLQGRERGVALDRACAAGALAASRLGAQPSLPTAAEVDMIMRA